MRANELYEDLYRLVRLMRDLPDRGEAALKAIIWSPTRNLKFSLPLQLWLLMRCMQYLFWRKSPLTNWVLSH